MKINVQMSSESRGFPKKSKKGKKGGNKRSQMLRMVMPLMSHTTGEKLADAIEGNNLPRLRAVWAEIGNEISKKLEQRARKGGLLR